MKTFRDLKVWQKSHALVLDIYRITREFPADEKYGLTMQLRRAVSSIPTNIVEGFKRRSNKEYARFLNIAEGSLEETKYHLLLACDLGYLDMDNYNALNGLCEEIGKMLHALYCRLNP